jgi:hypothetical protein
MSHTNLGKYRKRLGKFSQGATHFMPKAILTIFFRRKPFSFLFFQVSSYRFLKRIKGNGFI